MRWTYQRYRLWVINSSEELDLYVWDNWKALMPPINLLLTMTAEKVNIRSFQQYIRENRWLGFGPMIWNEECNLKWTTTYQHPKHKLKKLRFHKTEIWAPHWNQVNKDNIPPEVYIRLYHYPDHEKIKEGFLIAIPVSLYKIHQVFIDTALTQLLEAIPHSSIHTTTRFWTPLWKSANNIADMNPVELEKIVNSKPKPPSPKETKEDRPKATAKLKPPKLSH
ncbi:MAG: hypothetical protein V4590_04640 [Bacteroidota bacterium]